MINQPIMRLLKSTTFSSNPLLYASSAIMTMYKQKPDANKGETLEMNVPTLLNNSVPNFTTKVSVKS